MTNTRLFLTSFFLSFLIPLSIKAQTGAALNFDGSNDHVFCQQTLPFHRCVSNTPVTCNSIAMTEHHHLTF